MLSMKPALLLIDLQGDYLAAQGLQPPSEVFIAQTAALLMAAANCASPSFTFEPRFTATMTSVCRTGVLPTGGNASREPLDTSRRQSCNRSTARLSFTNPASMRSPMARWMLNCGVCYATP